MEVEAEGLLCANKLYGPVLVFRRLWQELGLARELAQVQEETWVQFPLEEAAFAMVLHRLLDPGSKLSTYRWLETVYRPELEALELQHPYRALDYLVQGKEGIEEALFARNRDLFSMEVDLVLFDTTLVHFEGQGPEGLATPARPGNYPDCVKVLVGLVMTAEGFPVAHQVFPGNTADIKAFQKALADLRRRFPLRRAIIVADRGLVSEDLIEGLEEKGPQAFLMPRGLRRYVELVGGELALKEEAVREEAHYDGKWVLRTNTELPAEEVAEAYKGLWRVEGAFRELKSGLEVRPVYVRTEDHVRGHILVCFLALVLEATFQRLLKEQGSPASYREVLADLEQVRAVRFEARGKAWLWRNELVGRANDAFQAVGIRIPSRVQPLTYPPLSQKPPCCGTSFSSALTHVWKV